MDLYSILFGNKYYNTTDLKYNNEYKLFFSNAQLMEYKLYKNKLIEEGKEGIIKLDLKSFNSKFIFYVSGECLNNLISDYFRIVISDFEETKSTIIFRCFQDILDARVYSEVEGSLNVESVPTTRTRIEQICGGAPIKTKNDVIIKNMIDGIDFVKNKPSFNKTNLLRLYNILTKDCLDDKELPQNSYYRDKEVFVGNYEGCPVEKIDEYMNSLFKLVEKSLHSNEDLFNSLLPHICHYYILYIHPYFDYNGRTARMVSLWVSLLTEKELIMPLYLSEAINDNKRQYYAALSETRDMNNDVSYFLIYLMNTAINYSLAYRNLEFICNELLKKEAIPSNIDKAYIKKIILKSNNTFFDWKKFLEYANIDITKQAALKALNKLVEYGVLSSITNSNRVKLFKLNDNMIKYSLNNK